MIDLEREHIMTLAQAAKRIPTGHERSIHISTLHRWRTRGLRGVRLEAIRLGGRVYTSREALARFAERLSRSGHEPSIRTVGQRRRADERAARELDKVGI